MSHSACASLSPLRRSFNSPLPAPAFRPPTSCPRSCARLRPSLLLSPIHTADPPPSRTLSPPAAARDCARVLRQPVRAHLLVLGALALPGGPQHGEGLLVVVAAAGGQQVLCTGGLQASLVARSQRHPPKPPPACSPHRPVLPFPTPRPLCRAPGHACTACCGRAPPPPTTSSLRVRACSVAEGMVGWSSWVRGMCRLCQRPPPES